MYTWSSNHSFSTVSEIFYLKETGIYAKYNLVKAQKFYLHLFRFTNNKKQLSSFYKRTSQQKIRTLDLLGRADSLRINSLLGSVA